MSGPPLVIIGQKHGDRLWTMLEPTRGVMLTVNNQNVDQNYVLIAAPADHYRACRFTLPGLPLFCGLFVCSLGIILGEGPTVSWFQLLGPFGNPEVT